MSTYNFLDKTGLTYFFNKIKGMFAPKKQGAEYIVGTQAASTAKWLGATEDSALFDGKVILYYLPQAGVSSTNVTLELTLSGGTTTGELPVYFNNGTTRMTTQFGRGSIIPLMFCTSRLNSSGTEITNSWIHLADYDTTNIYQLRKNGGTYISSTALYRYILCVTKSETTLLPLTTANNTTGTSKTLTTDSFNPFGEIFYYNSTTAVSANGSITASTLYRQMSIDTRYTFNTAKTLTSNKAAYLKCTPQSDGTVKLDTTTPLTQTLPNTADGKVYIYLGQTSSTYQLELSIVHPVYEYKNGALRLYSNANIPTKTSELTNDSGFTSNTGTVTSVAVKMNNSTKGTVTTSGTIDLGTVITDISDKQDTLVSGTNIKTINNNSLLGSGNISISGGQATDVQINGTSIVSSNTANIITNSAYNSITNKIATMADIGGGDNETRAYRFTCSSVIPGTGRTSNIFVIDINSDIQPNTFVYDANAVYSNVTLEIPYSLYSQCSEEDGLNIRLIDNNQTLANFTLSANGHGTIMVDYLYDYSSPDYLWKAILDTSNYSFLLVGQSVLIENDIQSKVDNLFTAMGSLGQDIQNYCEFTSNKVTSISSSSTNTQYPTALAVYNYINSLNGNGVSY